MKNVTNNINQLVSKTLTSVFGGLFLPSLINNGRKSAYNDFPKNFMPVLRFAVCSDIHLNGDEYQDAAVRLKNLFDDMYSFSERSDYKKFDALLVAGDFTGGGAEKEYKIFDKIVSEYKRPETKLLTVLGNHEFINYRDVDASVGYEIYKKYINDEVDTDVVINGYHFIGVSYNKDGKRFADKLSWLKEKLDAAVKENDKKPIFVYQHPHPFATVYGSINWGDFDLRKTLNSYPQVIDFSGHSHYAPSDPRSCWQGEFTAVGCGSLSAFMGNLNYIDGDKDAPGKSGGFRLCEVDADGNVKMYLYDIEHRIFFDKSTYYFCNVSDKKRRMYTWHQQKYKDTSPCFSSDSKITVNKCEDGIYLSFPDANGYYPAENYKIEVYNSNKKCVFSKTVISEYVRANNDDVRVFIGNLPKDSYRVFVNAFSPYAKKGGKLICNFTV